MFSNQAGVVAQMYKQAGIDVSRRGAYIARIKTLLAGLLEEALLDVGKQIAAKK